MIFMALVGGLGTFEGAILGAVVFFAIEAWFGAAGVWYLVGLGAAALVFALALPRGMWGWVEDKTALRLLPVGYRVRFLSARASRRRADVGRRDAAETMTRANDCARTGGRNAVRQDDRRHRNFVRHRRARRRTRASRSAPM